MYTAVVNFLHLLLTSFLYGRPLLVCTTTSGLSAWRCTAVVPSGPWMRRMCPLLHFEFACFDPCEYTDKSYKLRKTGLELNETVQFDDSRWLWGQSNCHICWGFISRANANRLSKSGGQMISQMRIQYNIWEVDCRNDEDIKEGHEIGLSRWYRKELTCMQSSFRGWKMWESVTLFPRKSVIKLERPGVQRTCELVQIRKASLRATQL